jgi:predicted MFS family arabinose efflux permease
LAANASSPPDQPSNQERLAVAALALTAFALNLNTNVLGALLPFLPAELGVGRAEGGYLVAAAALGSAAGALLVGPLAVRLGRRQALVVGLVVFVLASLCHGLARYLWTLGLLRAVAGLAVGIAYAAASALVAEAVPYTRRGAAMGWFNAGMFLAIPVGLPASIWLAQHAHWSTIFELQAGVGVFGAIAALMALPVAPAPEQPAAMRSLLRASAVRAGLWATLLHVGSFFTTVQLATKWLDESGMLPRAAQIWLWIGLGAASVLGSALLGRRSDRVGKRRFVLATSLVLVVCFLLLALISWPPGLLLVGVVLTTVAAARTGPLQALVSGLVAPGELAALMGLRGAVMQLGVLGFALVSVPLADRAGFAGVLVAAAVCQLLSFLVLWRRLPTALA